MIGGGPYRTPHHSPGEEEDLWFRLDEALCAAFQDPVWSWSIAWQVALDAGSKFPEVRAAAASLMSVIVGPQSEDDLVIREPPVRRRRTYR